MTGSIEKQYSELRKKHRLPDFRELDLEFELSDMEDTKFILRNIIRQMAEKLEFYTKMLEEILQPDASNLYIMHEMRSFNEAEKNRMYELYRKLMHLNRNSIEVSLLQDENAQAQFINSAFEEWNGLKQQLVSYVKIMKEAWKSDTDTIEDIGYLG